MMNNKIISLITVLVISISSVLAQNPYRYNENAFRIEFNDFKTLKGAYYLKDLKDNIIYDDNINAIEFLFDMCYVVSSKWHFSERKLISSFTKEEMIEYLVERGILTPMFDSFPHSMNTKDKYYTTKIFQCHLSFDFFADSFYVLTTPVFLAPIRPWNSAILDELVELEERFLSNEEKLKLLIDRGLLKKLTPKDDIKKLNKYSVVYRYQNKAFVDSVLKVTSKRAREDGEIFEKWYETVKDTLDKIKQNSK